MRAAHPSLVFGVLFCTLLGACNVQGRNALYGAMINFNIETAEGNPVQTVLVSGGSVQNLTTNDYSGAGAYVLAISAFDQKRGIYYWADDYTSPPQVFATDVKSRKALPPTVLDVSTINHFSYDNTNDRLLLFSSLTNGSRYLSSLQNGKPLQHLHEITESLLVQGVGYDEDGERLLMITNANGNLSLTTYNIATQQTKSFPLSSACQSQTFIGRIVWSPNQKKAFTFTFTQLSNSSSVLAYYVSVLDPDTGSCQPILIQIPNGYVLDWAIDPSLDLIYFTEIINMAFLYFQYDIVAKAASKPVVLTPGYQPVNLAVGPYYGN